MEIGHDRKRNHVTQTAARLAAASAASWARRDVTRQGSGNSVVLTERASSIQAKGVGQSAVQHNGPCRRQGQRRAQDGKRVERKLPTAYDPSVLSESSSGGVWNCMVASTHVGNGLEMASGVASGGAHRAAGSATCGTRLGRMVWHAGRPLKMIPQPALAKISGTGSTRATRQ